MSSLYELTTEVKALSQLLEEVGGDVSDGTQGEVLIKWMDEYGLAMKGKVDAYGSLVKNIESHVESIDIEIKRLRDRKEVFNNRIERLKQLADYAMRTLDVKKIEGEKFTISLQKAGGVQSLKILDEKGLPDKYLDIIPEQYVPSQERIRKGLEENDPELSGKAELLPRKESVRIK